MIHRKGLHKMSFHRWFSDKHQLCAIFRPGTNDIILPLETSKMFLILIKFGIYYTKNVKNMSSTICCSLPTYILYYVHSQESKWQYNIYMTLNKLLNISLHDLFFKQLLNTSLAFDKAAAFKVEYVVSSKKTQLFENTAIH